MTGVRVGVIAVFSALSLLGAGTGSATKVGSANIGVNLVGPNFITVDGKGSFRLFLTNTGPRKATAVTVFISLPSGVSFVPSKNLLCQGAGSSIRCNLGGLAPAHFKNVRITLTATKTTIGRILATAVSRQWDSDQSNNLAVVPLVAQPAPALADVAVTITPRAATPGTSSEPYNEVTVTNNGPGPALRTLLEYELPVGTTVKAVSATATTACGTQLIDEDPLLFLPNGKFEFCIPRIDPGESKTFVLGLVLPDSLGWSAHASAGTPDPDLSNNIAQGRAQPNVPSGSPCDCSAPVSVTDSPWQLADDQSWHSPSCNFPPAPAVVSTRPAPIAGCVWVHGVLQAPAASSPNHTSSRPAIASPSDVPVTSGAGPPHTSIPPATLLTHPTTP